MALPESFLLSSHRLKPPKDGSNDARPDETEAYESCLQELGEESGA